MICTICLPNRKTCRVKQIHEHVFLLKYNFIKSNIKKKPHLSQEVIISSIKNYWDNLSASHSEEEPILECPPMGGIIEM